MVNEQQFYQEVGRRIRKERKDRHITQEDLGKAVGLTRTSVTNIERGRQKLLLHTLADCSAALGVAIARLLPEASVEPRPNLDRVLKDLPVSERDFILAAVNAAQPGTQS